MHRPRALGAEVLELAPVLGQLGQPARRSSSRNGSSRPSSSRPSSRGS
jgi:hypothetical protein